MHIYNCSNNNESGLFWIKARVFILLLVSKLINYNFIEYTSPITLLMAIILLLYMKNIKVNKGKN